MAIAASALYVLTAAVFLASGWEKLVAPEHLGRVLQRGRLEGLSAAPVVQGLALVELAVGVGLLAARPGSGAQLVGAIVAGVHLAVVTPVGVRLIAVTGECGCTNAVGPEARGKGPQIAGLVGRNLLMGVALVLVTGGSSNEAVIAAASLALAAAAAVSAVTTFQKSFASTSQLQERVLGARPVDVVQNNHLK